MAVRFQSRSQALIFVVVLLSATAVYVFYDRLTGKTARYEAEERQRAAESASWRAEGAARKQCLDAIQAAAKVAFPTEIVQAPEQAPANEAALHGAPFARRDSRGIVFAQPAPADPPGAHGHLCDPTNSPAGAPTATPPPVVAFVDYACQEGTPECAGVVAWLDVANRRSLGVVRVSQPHHGASDGAEIERRLRAAIAKWL